ncbi:MAG TPA: hypothetical protein VMR41_01085 [Patescibacteria group bacterium]|nr:hypothetical protein [Patescibacteria group bacterium]
MNDKILTILEKLEKGSDKTNARLDEIEKRLSHVETNMATKDDLVNLKHELIEYSDRWFGDLLEATDKNKASIDEVINLKSRVRAIEKKLSLQQ